MSDILSSEELDALIDAFRDPSEAGGRALGSAVPHASDPASEVRLNEAQLSALRVIHGSFAWAAESSLADFLGPSVTINLAHQSQMEFGEYLPQCEKSLIATAAAPPLKGRILLEFSYSFAQLIVDTYFRGTASSGGRTQFNEVELSVLRDAMERVLSSYAESWRQLARLKPSVKSIEGYPGTNPVALPADPVLVAALEVRVGARKEQITLCLPNQVLKPFLAGVATQNASKTLNAASSVLEMQSGLQGLAQVGISGAVDDGFVPGAVIQLGNVSKVDVYSGGKAVGTGELVVIGDAVALRVLEVSPKRRALRQQRSA